MILEEITMAYISMNNLKTLISGEQFNKERLIGLMLQVSVQRNGAQHYLKIRFMSAKVKPT